ncbi:hypothetical protein AGLY_015210 [Aphis glycines]|uniref:Uncharacterized protein n=1 Tax=Aphis glycines TaxID=307491 RepID=A0A6G0T165_APHGL|nr:hypothetical protein AGLY_015210 [Aphis glycines]
MLCPKGSGCDIDKNINTHYLKQFFLYIHQSKDNKSKKGYNIIIYYIQNIQFITEKSTICYLVFIFNLKLVSTFFISSIRNQDKKFHGICDELLTLLNNKGFSHFLNWKNQKCGINCFFVNSYTRIIGIFFCTGISQIKTIIAMYEKPILTILLCLNILELLKTNCKTFFFVLILSIALKKLYNSCLILRSPRLLLVLLAKDKHTFSNILVFPQFLSESLEVFHFVHQFDVYDHQVFVLDYALYKRNNYCNMKLLTLTSIQLKNNLLTVYFVVSFDLSFEIIAAPLSWLCLEDLVSEIVFCLNDEERVRVLGCFLSFGIFEVLLRLFPSSVFLVKIDRFSTEFELAIDGRGDRSKINCGRSLEQDAILMISNSSTFSPLVLVTIFTSGDLGSITLVFFPSSPIHFLIPRSLRLNVSTSSLAVTFLVSINDFLCSIVSLTVIFFLNSASLDFFVSTSSALLILSFLNLSNSAAFTLPISASLIALDIISLAPCFSASLTFCISASLSLCNLASIALCFSSSLASLVCISSWLVFVGIGILLYSFCPGTSLTDDGILLSTLIQYLLFDLILIIFGVSFLALISPKNVSSIKQSLTTISSKMTHLLMIPSSLTTTLFPIPTLNSFLIVESYSAKLPLFCLSSSYLSLSVFPSCFCSFSILIAFCISIMFLLYCSFFLLSSSSSIFFFSFINIFSNSFKSSIFFFSSFSFFILSSFSFFLLSSSSFFSLSSSFLFLSSSFFILSSFSLASFLILSVSFNNFSLAILTAIPFGSISSSSSNSFISIISSGFE